WEALEQLSAGILKLPYTGGIVEAFRQVVEELQALEGLQLHEVVNVLFPEGDAAVVDLRALALNALQEVEEEDRAGFLSALVEAITQPEVPSEVHEVRIMSLHKSKGLSAPVTIISGCVEGLLPKQPVDVPLAEANAQLEEQ